MRQITSWQLLKLLVRILSGQLKGQQFRKREPATHVVMSLFREGERETAGLEAVERALQTPYITGHDMGVDLGGLHIGMAEEVLEHPDIHPLFQQVGGEAVAQGMTADLLVYPGQLRRPLYRLLQTGFKNMVAHLFAGTGINGPFACREYPLPAGLPGGIEVFSGQGLGEVDFAETGLQVLMMEFFNLLDVSEQLLVEIPGQDGSPVLATLAASDEDKILAEINVLDAETDAFHETQAAAVEDSGHQGMFTLHGSQQTLDLGLGQHRGRPGQALTAHRGDLSVNRFVEDIAIEEDQRIQSLPLGGG